MVFWTFAGREEVNLRASFYNRDFDFEKNVAERNPRNYKLVEEVV